MKAQTLVSEKTISAIKEYLRLSEKFKNSYFWSAPSRSNQRRKMESDNSFAYEDDGISLYFSIDCSCENIYVRKNISIDGVKKTAAALKKYIK